MATSRRTSRGPVYLMPGPGTGPRPSGWETLDYGYSNPWWSSSVDCIVRHSVWTVLGTCLVHRLDS